MTDAHDPIQRGEHDRMCTYAAEWEHMGKWADDCPECSLIRAVRADTVDEAIRRVEGLRTFLAAGPWITRDAKLAIVKSDALAALAAMKEGK